MQTHHPVFDQFPGFTGQVPEGFSVDFSGALQDLRLLDPGATNLPPRRKVAATPPSCGGDGYFDLVAVATAAARAAGQFTMVELGAGYGYWIVQGGSLARQRGLSVRLVGVEAEPGHFRLMQRHVDSNGFGPHEATLIEAAVAASDGTAYFETGSPLEWWGQSVRETANSAVSLPGAQIRAVRSLSLATILADFKNVDVVHMDIQGAEVDVLRTFAARSKVGMFIIGTHSKPIESELRAMFSGWRNLFDFSIGETYATEFGEVTYGDGMQCWSNPHWFPSHHRIADKRILRLVPKWLRAWH